MNETYTLPKRPKFLRFPGRKICPALDAIETVEVDRPAPGCVTVQFSRPITTFKEYAPGEPPYAVKNGAVVLVLRGEEAQALTGLFFSNVPWAYPGYNGVVLDVIDWAKAVIAGVAAIQEAQVNPPQVPPARIYAEPADDPNVVSIAAETPRPRPGVPQLDLSKMRRS